jgi:hypothetical protein
MDIISIAAQAHELDLRQNILAYRSMALFKVVKSFVMQSWYSENLIRTS